MLLHINLCMSPSQHDSAQGSLAPDEDHDVALENAAGWSKSLYTKFVYTVVIYEHMVLSS